MQSAPRLAIDYGSACTRAVLAWPDRPWQPLLVEGTAEPSSAVHVGADGALTAGAAAWRLAADDPAGFVESPLAAGVGTVRVRGRNVEIAGLVAATLRLIAAEAVRMAGVLPADVRMSVPAGWDPARRTWLRQAAHQAGLNRPQLVEAPVAALVATRCTARPIPVLDPPSAAGPPSSRPSGGGTTYAATTAPSRFVLVCDVGATAEVSVLRADLSGAEVMSTVTGVDAGGRAIDDRLVSMLLHREATAAPTRPSPATTPVGSTTTRRVPDLDTTRRVPDLDTTRRVPDLDTTRRVPDPDTTGRAADAATVATGPAVAAEARPAAGAGSPAADREGAAGAGPPGAEPPAGAGWGSAVDVAAVLRDGAAATVAVLRTGKEAVSQQPAVTVPLPAPGAAVVLSTTLVERAAEPVLRRLPELAAEALRAAELGRNDIAEVYAVGAAAAMPALPRVLERELGRPVRVAALPGAAVVLGVAEAEGAAAPAGEPAPEVPRLTVLRVLGLILPGAASVALFSHFVFTARGRTASSWGELAIAGVLALMLCLAAGPWIGAALARDAGLRGRWDAAGQISAGLLTADAFGVTVAALYAVAAGLYLVAPFGEPLQWSLLPVLPAALLAAAVAVIVRRRLIPPVIVESPLVATIILSIGSLLYALTVRAGFPPAAALWGTAATRTGGALIGVGVALLLFRITVLRGITAVVLGVFGFFIADPRAVGVFGVGIGIAVAVWWGQRLLTLVRP